MPTAAKIAAALAFGLLALFTAQLYVPQLPKGTDLGYFREITAAIGVVCGWWVMGRQVGRDYRAAAEVGLRTAVTIVFWALLGFSSYIMIKRSMRMMYDGPMEAVLGVFQLMVEYGQKMLVPEVVAVLLLGGMMAGLVSEWVSKRWP